MPRDLAGSRVPRTLPFLLGSKGGLDFCSSQAWSLVMWCIRPRAPLHGCPLPMELTMFPIAGAPVNYSIKRFSSLQTQLHSRETRCLYAPIVTSFFPEPARDRRCFQLKDGGTCPTLNLWTHEQTVLPKKSWLWGHHLLGFWFKVMCTTGSLLMSSWEQGWKVRGLKSREGPQGHPRITRGSLASRLEKLEMRWTSWLSQTLSWHHV